MTFDFKAWLDSFSLCKAPINGAIVIANIYTSLLSGLVQPAEAKEFLERCVMSPASEPSAQFQEICALDDASKLRFILLKEVDLSIVDPNERWVNIVTGSMFIFRLLGDAYKSSPSGSFSVRVLPREPVDDHDDEIWSETLNDFAANDVDWAAPDQHLGKPMDAPPKKFLKTCWVTQYELITATIATRSTYPQKGNAVRDALGLVHYREGASLVQLDFPVRTLLTKTPPTRVAQPTFCDAAGHSRFAADQPGPVCSANRKQEWGTTVDLDRFARGDSDLCGLPERVTEPVPVNPSFVKPTYIGRLSETRGESLTDNDDLFVGWICQKKLIDDMLDYITKAVA
jgi:hypothetical protein